MTDLIKYTYRATYKTQGFVGWILVSESFWVFVFFQRKGIV